MTPHPIARRLVGRIAAGSALVAAFAAPAAAQAWFYPSFQIPRVVERDYNFGVTTNNGTSALFQWREGVAANSQLSLDAGLADSDGDENTKLFVGGQYARELTRATVDQPLDLLLTAGAGLAVGDGPDLFRFPVGVSVGHRFLLEGNMAVTPYVHPRISLDFVTGPNSGSDLTLDFDVGGSFELTRQLSLRASLLFSGAAGGDNTGFGISLTWSPAPITRR
jgi:hypothetical protein